MRAALTILLATLILLQTAAAPQTTLGEEHVGIQIETPTRYKPAGVKAGNVLQVVLKAESLPPNLTVVLDAGNSTLTLQANITQTKPGHHTLAVQIPEDASPGVYDLLLTAANDTLIAREPNSVAVFQAWPSPLRIVHLTDIHLGQAHPGAAEASYLASGLLFAEIAGAHVTIITGDAVDEGGRPELYESLLWVYERFPLPKLQVPGHAERVGDPSLSTWSASLGPQAYYHQRWGPYLFIGLDTSEEGVVPEDQLEWLEEVLSQNADAPAKVIFAHHPLFKKGLVGEYWLTPENLTADPSLLYETWAENPQKAARFLGLVLEYNVTLVLAGHVHADGLVRVNNKTLFVTTTSTGGEVGDGGHRGVKLIELQTDGTARIIPTTGAKPFDRNTAINLETLDVRLVNGNETLAMVVEAHRFRDAQYAACCIMTLSFRIPNDILGSETRVLALSPGYILPTRLTQGLQYALASAEVPIDPQMNFTLIATNREDTLPPSVSIEDIQPPNPTAGQDPVEVIIRAADDAWGVKKVVLLVKTGEETPQPIPATPLSQDLYKATLPPQEAPSIQVKALAVDVSGKQSETNWTTLNYKMPPKQETAPPEPPTTGQTTTTQTPSPTPTQTQTPTPTTQTPRTTSPPPPTQPETPATPTTTATPSPTPPQPPTQQPAQTTTVQTPPTTTRQTAPPETQSPTPAPSTPEASPTPSASIPNPPTEPGEGAGEQGGRGALIVGGVAVLLAVGAIAAFALKRR